MEWFLDLVDGISLEPVAREDSAEDTVEASPDEAPAEAPAETEEP